MSQQQWIGGRKTDSYTKEGKTLSTSSAQNPEPTLNTSSAQKPVLPATAGMMIAKLAELAGEPPADTSTALAD